jgi:hypothetical protein
MKLDFVRGWPTELAGGDRRRYVERRFDVMLLISMKICHAIYNPARNVPSQAPYSPAPDHPHRRSSEFPPATSPNHLSQYDPVEFRHVCFLEVVLRHSPHHHFQKSKFYSVPSSDPIDTYRLEKCVSWSSIGPPCWNGTARDAAQQRVC